MNRSELARIARKHGTPVVVIDHEEIRRNYASFKRHLPKVQAYYAVKANPAPEIVRTLYRAGASFDVASLPEFMLVYENVRRLPPGRGRTSSGTRSSTRTPSSPRRRSGPSTATARSSPTTTGRSSPRSRRTRPTRAWRCACGSRTRARWWSCPRSSAATPGEAADLIDEAFRIGLVVEGLSFHVGSQCTNFDNFVQALNMAAAVRNEALSPRPRAQDPRHRRRLSRAPTTATSSPSAPSRARSTPRSPGSSPPTSRSWPSPAASWWPRRPPRWPG